jgi:hypothetical protein
MLHAPPSHVVTSFTHPHVLTPTCSPPRAQVFLTGSIVGEPIYNSNENFSRKLTLKDILDASQVLACGSAERVQDSRMWVSGGEENVVFTLHIQLSSQTN